MTTKMTPSLGPVTNMTYQSGMPGGQWTDDEVKATRLRILQMIHPNWDVKKAQGTWNGLGVKTEKVKFQYPRPSLVAKQYPNSDFIGADY